MEKKLIKRKKSHGFTNTILELIFMVAIAIGQLILTMLGLVCLCEFTGWKFIPEYSPVFFSLFILIVTSFWLYYFFETNKVVTKK